MKMKQRIAMITVLALMLSASGAMAMPVRYSDGSATVQGVSAADGLEISFATQTLQLLGVDQEGNYRVYANQNFYTVSADAMADVLALLDPQTVESLPAVQGRAVIGKGAKGGDVARLQAALIALGYLEGAADGDFGGGTERAIQAFQAALGMEQTGSADENLFLLILSMAEAEQVVAPPSPEAPYAAFADRAQVDMQPIYDSALTLEYDDMTGRGFITNGEAYEFDLSGEADIDKYQLVLRFGLLVRETEAGAVSIEPAVEISCLCVRRPVLTEVIVKAGAHRGTAQMVELNTVLEGVNTWEKGVAILNDEMVEALAGAAEAGELKLRLNGQYNTFDVSVGAESLASLSKIGEVARAIRG